LYRSQEMWPELLDNLRLEAGTAVTAAERVRVRHQIAHILSEKLQSYDEALEAYGAVLDEKPDDEMALDAVFQLVERDEQLCRAAADLLVPALRQTGLRERLVKALRLRLREEHEPVARVETLRTIAQVHEVDLKKPVLAMDALLDALSETPDAEELYRDIERLAEITQGWAKYAQVLRQRAAEVFDSELSGQIWSRAARIFEEKLEDADQAILAYQTASEQAGDRIELLDALDRLYTQSDNTDAVVALLDRRMALVESEQDRSRLLCRQGQLQLDKQDAPTEAIISLREALELDVHNVEASDLLSRLLGTKQYFDETFEILDRVYRDRPSGRDLASLHQLRVERAASSEERLDMRRSLAQVLEDECKDPLAAQRVLQEALTDALSEEGLRDEMERLLAITDGWVEGAQALLSALAAQKKGLSAELGVSVAQRAADWLRDKAHDQDAAEKALDVALGYEPDNDEILEQLQGLQNTGGKEKRLLETLRSRARVALDDGTKIEFLRQCFLLSTSLNDTEIAEQSIRDILDIDDQDFEALAQLTDLRSAAEDYAEVHALLQRRAELESDPAKLRSLKFDTAQIARLHLKEENEAILLLEELLFDDAKDAQVISALQSAYNAASRYDDLDHLISTQLEGATDPEVIASLKVGLARLRREQLKDQAGAVELLEEVYTQSPDNVEAAQYLAEIYEASAAYEALIGLYARQRDHAMNTGDQVRALELLKLVAVVSETKLHDLELGAQSWSEIRTLEDSPENREELLRIFNISGKQTQAAALLEEICAGLVGSQALERRAELTDLYRAMSDTEGVVRTVEGSLALAPTDPKLKLALRHEYEQAGRWNKVAEMVLIEAESAGEKATKLELYREAAQIYAAKQNDAASSVPILERAAALAPDNREILLELCDAYSAGGQGGAAAEVLEKIVESYGGKRSKDLGEIHRRLATAYLSQNQADRALAELDKAFRIEPGNIQVLKQLGEVAITAGDMQKAQQMFRALLLQRLDESSPITKAEVFCRLGQIHRTLGETPKAKQMFERALQTDPSMKEAQEGLNSL